MIYKEGKIGSRCREPQAYIQQDQDRMDAPQARVGLRSQAYLSLQVVHGGGEQQTKYFVHRCNTSLRNNNYTI